MMDVIKNRFIFPANYPNAHARCGWHCGRLSTAILPHNFIELLEAQIEILREKKRTPAELNLLPDFQTGGLMDISDYNKGNGKIKLRGRIEPHKTNRLVITELPHGVTTESLITSIEEAVKKKKCLSAPSMILPLRK